MVTNSGLLPVSAKVNLAALPHNGRWIQLHKVEVNNRSGSNARMGWGEQLTCSILSPNLLGVAATEDVIVKCSHLPNMISFDVDTTPGSITLQYWNGSSYVSISTFVAEGDLDSTGQQSFLFDSLPMVAIDGFYRIKLSGSTSLILNSVVSGRILDDVGVVVSGNNAVEEYDAMSPIRIKNLFVYSSVASASNMINIDYVEG